MTTIATANDYGISPDYGLFGVYQGLNCTYTLVLGAFVFLMHAGFAMLCAGAIRSKNTMNILLQTILDAAVSALMFYAVGYGFAFGEGVGGTNGFIGNAVFALARFTNRYGLNVMGTPAEWQMFVFQWAFAATATTIPAGAVAERFNFNAYFGYTVLLSGLVYPVVVHWAWCRHGWMGMGKIDSPRLFNCGYIDFAGSGVVHMTGGFSGLAGCIMVGPRMGRFDSNGKPVDMPGHSATLVVLGTVLLWFGWYGFNPGSFLIVTTRTAATVVGRAAVTTTLCGAACSVTALFAGFVRTRSWDLLACCNGALVGFVVITANCHVLEPWAAIVIGIVGAFVFDGMCWVLLKLRIDDPLSAVPMHGFGGMWGVFATGLLAKQEYVWQNYAAPLGYSYPPNAWNNGGNANLPQWQMNYGAFYPGGGGRLLACQIIGILCIVAWTMSVMGAFFAILKALNMIRISPEEEQAGLDMSKHGGSAYNYNHGLGKPEKAPVG